MRDINPEKSFKQPKSFNANEFERRLGFALRDDITTASTASPVVINPLGASIAGYLHPDPASQIAPTSSALRYRTDYPLSTPGIMTLLFEPVFAPQAKEQGGQIIEDIMNNLWSLYRVYYNGADSVDPAEIAIRSMAQMMIEVYVTYIRRALKVMKLAYNANNRYIRNDVLLKAMGLEPPSDFEIRTKLTGWIQYFNDSILGPLNAMQWITGVFPGEHRWASLVSEIYKDESINSGYVQMYMFCPRSFWSFVEKQPIEPGIFGCKLIREEWPTDFQVLLEKVHDMIRTMYYDKDGANIQAMFQTINVRGFGKFDSKIKPLTFDVYPLEGEELKLTYDWNMLMAIHNATVMYGLRAFDVTQYVPAGRAEQRFAFDQTTFSYPWFTTEKIFNLPNFGASQEQFINAMQWCLIGTFADIEDADIDPRVLGTDVLVDSYVYTLNEHTGQLVKQTMNQLLPYDMVKIDAASSNWWPCIWGGDTSSPYRTAGRNMTFNFAPIQYAYYRNAVQVAEDGAMTVMARNVVTDILANLEVVYRVDASMLKAAKKAFVNNFWGYPIKLQNEGKFVLPDSNVTETPAELGVGDKTKSTIS